MPAMRRTILRIAAKFDRLHFCYEAGPTGYGLHRVIKSLGHDCMVVAPSQIRESLVTASRRTVETRLRSPGY